MRNLLGQTVKGTMSRDGKESDAYVLVEFQSLSENEEGVVGIIERSNV